MKNSDKLVTVGLLEKSLGKAFERNLKPIKEELADLREVVDSHTVSLDGIVKILEQHTTEFAAVKIRLDRHEGWIREIATKIALVVRDKSKVYKVGKRIKK